MLDKQGIAIALIMAVLILIFSSVNYLSLVLIFFIAAVIVTKYEFRNKKDMGIYEHERSWENVLSNGALPTLLAVLSTYIGDAAFIGAIAAITADKFASELGVLDRNPIFLGGFKKVKAGKSGAVSILGFAMSLVGGCIIGLGSMVLFDKPPVQALIIGMIGLAGSVIDSIFGIFEEQGIGTKGTTNFICSLAGSIIGYFLI